jgi:hypothetical protein
LQQVNKGSLMSQVHTATRRDAEFGTRDERQLIDPAVMKTLGTYLMGFRSGMARFIARRPLECMATAVGIGAMLGWLTKRR